MINNILVKDFRQFINLLESKAPDEIIRIKKEVSPKFEITATLKKLEIMNRYPAVIFENVRGYQMPVVANIHATRKKLALALGVREEDLLKSYMKLEEKRILPKVCVDGPVKEVIKTDDKVDITELPIVTHNEKDVAPYITAGVVVLKHPDTGVRNSSIFRIMVKEKRKFGILVGNNQHAWYAMRRAWELGKSLEIAIVIGNHPAITIGSQSRLKLGEDEYEVMGAILDEPLEIVKCETVDLEVPAYAEIVIEGEIPPHILEPEAPFGEYHWYYGEKRDSPIVNIKAITHRKDAIYQTVFSAHREHNYTGLLSKEASIYRQVKNVVPTLQQVRVPSWGGQISAILSIRKMLEGQGKYAGLAAIAQSILLKNVIVVDDDTNIFNDEEVFWAVMTRTYADKNFVVIPDILTSSLSPTSYKDPSREEKGGNLDVRLIIDATRSLGSTFYEKAEPPRDVVDKIEF